MVFFYKRVLGKLWDDNLVPRSINDYAIPRVLTREEVERLLDATPNLKYKAMFALVYSSGLRVSEVIHLNYEDLSRTNMQIYIRNSKTHSSRYAILSKPHSEKCGHGGTAFSISEGTKTSVRFPSGLFFFTFFN